MGRDLECDWLKSDKAELLCFWQIRTARVSVSTITRQRGVALSVG